MSDTRFSVALSQGLFTLPDGPIAVVNAQADMDLSFAPADALHLSQSLYPAYTALDRLDFTVTTTPEAQVDASLIIAHRAKPASFDLLARALDLTAPGGLIAVEGPKTDGIESLLKATKARFDGVEAYSKAHGKVFWFTRPGTLPDLSDWHAQPRHIAGDFTTKPGVFSADAIDKGTALLTAHLPTLKGRVADFGGGWGALSRHVLLSPAVTALDLIEADYIALDCAKLNVTDPRAQFIWGDVITHTAPAYDVIVSNPPFHTGRKPTPELGQKFIARAADLLAPKGQFWMVANRNLPYEQVLGERFAQVDTVAQTAGFKVICAKRPLTQSQSARAKR